MQSNTKNQNSCEILYANVKISGFVAVLGQPVDVILLESIVDLI
jgi:hypothetical protein